MNHDFRAFVVYSKVYQGDHKYNLVPESVGKSCCQPSSEGGHSQHCDSCLSCNVGLEHSTYIVVSLDNSIS